MFFATGQDPRRKDVLELLLRLFDREGLQLIPAVEFAAPLPELEALKRGGGPRPTGSSGSAPTGSRWLAAAAPRQGLAPYYNLLDPRVQEAMLDVVRELVARYANHVVRRAGPAALGRRLRPTAGRGLGLRRRDDRPLRARHANASVPRHGPAALRRAGQVSAGRPAATAWLDWRAGVVADFHRQLEREIAVAPPEREALPGRRHHARRSSNAVPPAADAAAPHRGSTRR